MTVRCGRSRMVEDNEVKAENNLNSYFFSDDKAEETIIQQELENDFVYTNRRNKLLKNSSLNL